MYYTYILFSLKDKKTYVGYTQDFKRRFGEHNSGEVRSTKHRQPLEVLLLENLPTMREAKIRESWWKSGAGRRKLKELFNQSK